MGTAAADIDEWLPLMDVNEEVSPYQMGFLIGKRFSHLIKGRVSGDPLLQNELIPFARSSEGQSLFQALSKSNRNKYPDYWDELQGTAEGSGVSFLHLLLLNFRKEVVPFLPNKVPALDAGKAEECSDILVLDNSLAFVGHNEDANVSVRGYVYLVKAPLRNGGSYTAYTYAGELPSCAFGFNSYGFAFTLNSVPPIKEEIEKGGIGRNFVSRDLLEATSIEDALKRIHLPNISVGHSYNLIDTNARRILNVETASKNRISVLQMGSTPLFHANVYLHLKIRQANDESSISRQTRAAELPILSQKDALFLLGDCSNDKYPIYMQGPNLYTLCTALIDVDKKSITIYKDNPNMGNVAFEFFLTE